MLGAPLEWDQLSWCRKSFVQGSPTQCWSLPLAAANLPSGKQWSAQIALTRLGTLPGGCCKGKDLVDTFIWLSGAMSTFHVVCRCHIILCIDFDDSRHVVADKRSLDLLPCSLLGRQQMNWPYHEVLWEVREGAGQLNGTHN